MGNKFIAKHIEINKLKRKIFRVFELLRKEPIPEKLNELVLNERKSTCNIQELQLEKVKKILKYAYNNSRFYRKYYSEHEQMLYNINSLKDIECFPILTKELIRKNLKDIICSNGRKKYIAKTSGSIGEPLKLYKDRITSAYSYAAMYRGLRWFGIEICDREAYLWGIPLGKKDFYLAKAKDFILNRFRERKFDLTDEVNSDFYHKMAHYKPKILSGYANLIYEFAQYLHKNKIDIKPVKLKIIKYTAEMMYDYQKEFISKVLSCPVVSEYGSAEAGVMAFQCPHGGNHILTDCVHLEFKYDIDSGFYKIIATNLHSYVFPIIRYDTGDLIKSNKIRECSCALPFPIMDKIIGRSSDIIITPEGKKIHSNIFSYIIKELIKRYQIINQILFIQTKIDEIKVILKMDDNDNKKINKDIRKLIHHKISKNIKVVFVEENFNKKQESGKLRYFISELNKE